MDAVIAVFLRCFGSAVFVWDAVFFQNEGNLLVDMVPFGHTREGKEVFPAELPYPVLCFQGFP